MMHPRDTAFLSICSIRRQNAKRQRGFSLMEIAVVLIIIGILAGAVTSGRDAMRNARNIRAVTEFVAGWMSAYDLYVTQTGTVPGDNLITPSHRVGNSNEPLCNTGTSFDLNNVFHAQGIRIPSGRGLNAEDRYVYLDSRGFPHEMRLCFQNAEWSDVGSSQGVYVVNRRNVMVLQGVTPEMAILIDQQFDGRVDARFGRVREINEARSILDNTRPWPYTEMTGSTGIPNAGTGESLSPEMTLYILMRS